MILTDAARGEDFWWISDANTVPLAPDGGRIAVFTQDPGALARLAGPTRSMRIEPLAVPGWHIMSPADGDRAADMRGTIAAVLADPGITLAAPVFSAPDGPGIVIPTDIILVRFGPGIDNAAQDRAIAEIPGAQILEHDSFGITGLVRIRIASRSGLDALDASNLLSTRADIAYAEPDFLFTGSTCALPNDTDFPSQWALRNIGQNGGTPGIDIRTVEAFDIEPGDPSTVIVILDVGIDGAHPDLAPAPGADFTSDPIPSDGTPVNACDNHGTLVAGCAGATTNNTTGIAGAAGRCRVASARIGIANNPACDGTWTGQLSWTVDALDWAQSIGARITNNSNAYPISSPTIKAKYDLLRDEGIVHFAAAGNTGASIVTYPASLDAVRAVGAITNTGALAGFSNHGPDLDLVAPGDDILTTDRAGSAGIVPGDFATVDGTSFASPYGASVAALVATLKPGLSAPMIESVLDLSATDLGAPGFDTTFGNGLVNARAALDLAACSDSWSPTGISGPAPRTNLAMAYDSDRDVAVLFGGTTDIGAAGDTWELGASGWTQRLIAGPSPRSGCAMVYDQDRSVIVLFGGLVNGTTPTSETWEYDGIAWSLRTSTGPSPRTEHAMAFDSARGKIVLFGGVASGVPNAETWEWDGAAWTQIPVAGPSARSAHTMTFDADRAQFVLFGGDAGATETWTYQGPAGITPGSWALASTSGPSGRENSAMAFDAHTSTVVLYGGDPGGASLGDTWEWDGTSWRMRSFFGPVARARHTLIARDSSHDVLLFGGIDDSSLRLGDSWTWMRPAPTVTDPPDSGFTPVGGTVHLIVEAEGVGVLTYQWRRNGVELTDGPRISGAATAELTISDAQVADAGSYSVRIEDPCGSTISVNASIGVGCAGDVNADGATTVGDFNILASNFGMLGGALRTTGDLSGDGNVTVADFNILAADFACQAPE